MSAIYHLAHLLELREGIWPDDNNYYCGGHTNWINSASFTGPCEIAGEIEARIAMVPQGSLITDRYTHNKTHKELVIQYRIPHYDLSITLYYMLSYISGHKRKTTPYTQYKAVLKNQSKKRLDKLIT